MGCTQIPALYCPLIGVPSQQGHVSSLQKKFEGGGMKNEARDEDVRDRRGAWDFGKQLEKDLIIG